jgi:predicted AAA+ superfamily ATPase
VFLDNYVSDIVNRDVVQLSEIERGPQMRSLIRMLAARSGQLVVPGRLASELGLPQSTVSRYLSLLEEVFLIKRVPAWSRNLSSRAVATAKVAMVDSGIAVNLLGQDAGVFAGGTTSSEDCSRRSSPWNSRVSSPGPARVLAQPPPARREVRVSDPRGRMDP